jgi:hypothetical protein
VKPYKDFDYAVTRIRDTIVMHGDVPVEVLTGRLSVRDVAGFDPVVERPKVPVKAPILVRDIKTGGQKIACISELTPSLPELGYANHRGHATYVCRLPKRRDWRQGIRYSNLTTLCGLNIDEVPYSALSDTLRGEFPSFERCLAGFNKSKTLKSIAWSNDWAVDRAMVVWYQGLEVGNILEGRVSLKNNFMYLQEALDESRR